MEVRSDRPACRGRGFGIERLGKEWPGSCETRAVTAPMQRNPKPSTPEPKRLHAVVQGRVQGVGFRYFVLDRAEELRLTGICRNLRTGEVEVIAEGEQGALEALLVALKQGPRMAHVENVHAVWLPASGEFVGFRIAGTA